jgi:hypothetical protein
MKKFRCSVCHNVHDIDKYGWIQCDTLGYIELGSYIYEMEKYLSGRLAKLEKDKTKS